jgi:hypothetical protein
VLKKENFSTLLMDIKRKINKIRLDFAGLVRM